MEMKGFFDFGDKSMMSTVQFSAVGLKKNENGLNDRFNLIKGDYKGVDFPVIFKQEHGKRLTDILGTGWPSFYLISDRMKIILEENNLTGWKVFPVKAYDKKKNEILGYHGFSISGQCGPVNFEKSEIIEKRLVPNGPLCKYYRGMFIDNWDGTDFFIPEETAFIIITKKAADVLKKNKITNMELRNLAELEIDVEIVNINDK